MTCLMTGNPTGNVTRRLEEAMSTLTHTTCMGHLWHVFSKLEANFMLESQLYASFIALRTDTTRPLL